MQNVFFTIYKITNQINEKIYIGKHQTSNLDDNYMGSGKYLTRAINKYGLENFKKEILFVFDNEQDMTDKEKELVTEEFVSRKDTYNLCPGGKGGFGYINANGLRGPGNIHKSPRAINKMMWLFKNDAEFVQTHRDNISKALKKRYETNPGPWAGKKHTEESKQKMREVKKDHGIGKENSQFGTMWITNGTENKKIKKIDHIPEGWYKGRKLS